MSYKCNLCNKKFKDRRYLECHLKRKVPCTTVFKCPKCATIFQSQHHLTRHMDRLTTCAPEEIPVIEDGNKDNRCQYCNKTYSTKSSLARHLKTCNKDINMHVIMNLLNENRKTNNELKMELRELRAGRGSSVSINNNVTNNSLYLNSNLCIFGEEDYTLLDQEKIKNFLLDDAPKFVPRLITELHANVDLPQYHNVYYDVQREQAMIFTRVMINGVLVSTWQKKTIVEVSQVLVTKAKRYPTCMPLAQNIKPNSLEEQRYCQSMQIVTKEYQHSEQDIINHKRILSEITKNPGFFKMIDDTTYVSALIPLN